MRYDGSSYLIIYLIYLINLIIYLIYLNNFIIYLVNGSRAVAVIRHFRSRKSNEIWWLFLSTPPPTIVAFQLFCFIAIFFAFLSWNNQKRTEVIQNTHWIWNHSQTLILCPKIILCQSCFRWLLIPGLPCFLSCFIHRSRLWAWRGREGSRANTHWLTPRFHAQLQFLSKSDVWHGYYSPVPIWGADDGLISLFPCDSSL